MTESHHSLPILKLKEKCVSKLADMYPMLQKKYGEEELCNIFREEELTIMRKKYNDFLAAKSRFASLKGNVLSYNNCVPNHTTITPKIDSPASGSSQHEKIEVGNGNYFPYSSLIQGKSWPEGIDPTKREQYLSPEEFQTVFKMSLLQFNELDKFKRIRLKKEHSLF